MKQLRGLYAQTFFTFRKPSYIACLLRMNIGFDSLQGRGAPQPNRKYEHSEKCAASIIRREETTVNIKAKRTETLSPVVQYHFFLLARLPFFRAAFPFTLKMEVELSPKPVYHTTRRYFPGDRDLDVRPVRISTLTNLITSHLQTDRLVNTQWKYEGEVVAVARCTSSINGLKQSKIPRRRYSY